MWAGSVVQCLSCWHCCQLEALSDSPQFSTAQTCFGQGEDSQEACFPTTDSSFVLIHGRDPIVSSQLVRLYTRQKWHLLWWLDVDSIIMDWDDGQFRALLGSVHDTAWYRMTPNLQWVFSHFWETERHVRCPFLPLCGSGASLVDGVRRMAARAAKLGKRSCQVVIQVLNLKLFT